MGGIPTLSRQIQKYECRGTYSVFYSTFGTQLKKMRISSIGFQLCSLILRIEASHFSK